MSIEAMNLQRGDRCEVFIDGEWHPSLFIAVDFFGNEPIVQRIGFMPTFATWKTLRVSDAALKAAQPQEYPSSADDEATRWRHGEPQGAISDERIAQIYADETGFDLHKEPAALLDFARALLAAAQEGK